MPCHYSAVALAPSPTLPCHYSAAALAPSPILPCQYSAVFRFAREFGLTEQYPTQASVRGASVGIRALVPLRNAG